MKALIIIGIVLWLCFLAVVSIVLFDSMDYDPAWDEPMWTELPDENEESLTHVPEEDEP